MPLNSDDVEKVIDLKGSLSEVSVRSVLSATIQATISSICLDIVFSYNVSNIELEVYSASGSLICKDNIDTQTHNFLSIDVSDWDSGIYQIRFVNSEGQYMYGTFKIE